MLHIALTLLSTFLTRFLFQVDLIGTEREEELIIILSTVAVGLLSGGTPPRSVKELKITDDRKWYFYVDASGETHRIPATRPYKTGFSPSTLDRLKYLKEFGGPSAAAASAFGAALDYTISSADTILDGSFTAIAIALSGLMAVGVYKNVKKIKCPYCFKGHKLNAQICPITDLLLWYWEEQEPLEVFRRETITGFNEVVEYISRNYYPISYTETIDIASEIVDKADLPIPRNEFANYLSKTSLDSQIRRVMLLRKDIRGKSPDL